jgi:Zn-dependent alcohol dehydrogenase
MTRTIALADINHAFDALRAGHPGRAVVVF